MSLWKYRNAIQTLGSEIQISDVIVESLDAEVAYYVADKRLTRSVKDFYNRYEVTCHDGTKLGFVQMLLDMTSAHTFYPCQNGSCQDCHDPDEGTVSSNYVFKLQLSPAEQTLSILCRCPALVVSSEAPGG